MENLWSQKLLHRFIQYIKIESTSNDASETTPSTQCQWDIANVLFEEMKAIGLQDVSIDEKGYIYGFIPANVENVPNIGFIAHYDTTSDFNGKEIKPQIWENYQGENLILNKNTGFELNSDFFPHLKECVGETLITTDGTTLLSADDKAGVAEIMTAADYLITHPEIPHGRISIAFNPDEEIGRGAHHFNVEKFGAEWAYTMDGSGVGEIEYENFNAAEAIVNITGVSVHPGYAFGKMKNAGLLATEFISLLPNETPSNTQDFEGFYHLTDFSGSTAKASVKYIIRDHNADTFAQRKQIFKEKVDFINQKYGDETATLVIKDQYFNMKNQFEGKMHIIDFATDAMKSLNITPQIKAIRGGTDGAQLSFMGLPCPNLFAGGHNFHGPYEYVTLQAMEKATEVIINISKQVAGFEP